MPDRAVGRTIAVIVRVLVRPSAVAASRSVRGTCLSISAVDRTTSGSMIMANAMAPAMPENPNRVTHIA
jgi:hypothetical protein